jgi:hypothetical protein
MSPLQIERGIKEISFDIDQVIEDLRKGKNLEKKLEELIVLLDELKTFKEQIPS